MWKEEHAYLGEKGMNGVPKASTEQTTPWTRNGRRKEKEDSIETEA